MIRKYVGRMAFYLLIAGIIFYAVFPFYWAIVSSLKTGSSLFQVEFWPSHPTLENYISLFQEQPFAHNIVNSLIVAVGATGISLFLAMTAAYALGRIRFCGRTAMLMTILSV